MSNLAEGERQSSTSHNSIVWTIVAVTLRDMALPAQNDAGLAILNPKSYLKHRYDRKLQDGDQTRKVARDEYLMLGNMLDVNHEQHIASEWSREQLC